MMYFTFLLLLAGIFACDTASLRAQSVTLGTAGKEQHDVYNTSATASATLLFDSSTFQLGSNVFVHVTIESHVGRELLISTDGLKLEVRDAHGRMPRETEVGCLEHFFSQCYTGWLYPRRLVQIPFKSFGKLEWDKNLSREYELTRPGTYTVVGYVCGIGNTRDCFRTNVAKFTIK